MKFKFHIPTQQYGFVEIEGTEKERDKMERLYNSYAEEPVNFQKGDLEKLETFTGEIVYFNKIAHTYQDENGNIMMSGSRYKKSLEKPFDFENISKAVAKKYDVEQQDIKDMWKQSGEISRAFGNAIHYAIEGYIRHREVGKIVDEQIDDDNLKSYHLPKHPWLRQVVESFPLKDENIIPEALVSDVKNLRAGHIDGIHIIDEDKKICEVIDIKSDGKIEDTYQAHFHQLSFYAHILMAHGWKVNKLSIWNYNESGWSSFDSKVLKLKEKK